MATIVISNCLRLYANTVVGSSPRLLALALLFANVVPDSKSAILVVSITVSTAPSVLRKTPKFLRLRGGLGVSKFCENLGCKHKTFTYMNTPAMTNKKGNALSQVGSEKSGVSRLDSLRVRLIQYEQQ